jgi:Fe-S cluster assembly protein SufB
MAEIVKENLTDREYKYGFETVIETDYFPMGLSEDVVHKIADKRNDPQFVRDFRIKAYRHWLTLKEPTWADVSYPKIDFQGIRYYSAPKKKPDGSTGPASLGDIDPELIETFNKLGIPIGEQKRLTGVAIDVVFDSVSVGTSHQEELAAAGVIFCSLTEAIQKHPEIVEKYLGKIVPYKDNYYAALNSAVFTDGSFVYIPKGVRCPLDLSTYFRINAKETGQFERTLIVAEPGSYVSYLEGCTAPMRDENQLHAAVVELITHDNSEIKYSTVQNWYAGDKDGRGGIYNFVTKRGLCEGANSKISWTQVESGSSITWKYPSVILKGDNSCGEFYSVALTNNKMQADTGTKMVHIGKNTSSRIISKGISCGQSRNTYRGQVKILPSAENARNFSQCDSMLVGDQCTANTHPYLEVKNSSAIVEHEATTSKISGDQIFYMKSRGVDEEGAVSLLLHGFCKEVFKTLPLEFSIEAVKLLEMKLEGSVG